MNRGTESILTWLTQLSERPCRYHAGERNAALALFGAVFLAVVAAQGMM
jgi:hypothetical protein